MSSDLYVETLARRICKNYFEGFLDAIEAVEVVESVEQEEEDYVNSSWEDFIPEAEAFIVEYDRLVDGTWEV